MTLGSQICDVLHPCQELFPVVFGFGFFPSLAQAVAFPVSFDDMTPMGEAVEQGSGEPLGAEDLGPLLEGQVGGEHHAVVLICPADDLEEQLGGCFGERNVSHLVDEQQMDALKLFVQAL